MEDVAVALPPGLYVETTDKKPTNDKVTLLLMLLCSQLCHFI